MVERFRERALNGNAIAQNNLGALYLKGHGVAQSYEQARHWFEMAAEAELPGAMFNLAMVYLRGYGVEIDINKSNALLQQSAQHGDRDAQFFLGLHYSNGTGVNRDIEAAKLWFRRAAEQELAVAMYNLGILYLNPDPDLGDEDLALAWLEKARAAKYPGIDLIIAKINLSSKEDPARIALGVEQYIALAEANNLEAQIQLGMMYTLGQHIEQSYDEGRFWLERAATQGAAHAQLNLGNLYAEGIGVDKDLVKAMAWYSIAADNGDPAASQNAELLRESLSKDERKAANLESEKLRARYGSGLDSVGR